MTFSQSALLNKDREARYNARIKRTLDELVPISEKITLLAHASANRVALKGLKTGMPLEEAKRRMGDRTGTGSSGYFTNIVLKNPHRSMTFYGSKGERIEILLYLTEVRKLDGAFTPEQFTSVHFINDRLSGWGWDSLQLLKEGKRLGEDCHTKLLEAQQIPKKLLGV
ncbi:MAG: hypothetical protein ACJ0DI_13565 [bacterium]